MQKIAKSIKIKQENGSQFWISHPCIAGVPSVSQEATFRLPFKLKLGASYLKSEIGGKLEHAFHGTKNFNNLPHETLSKKFAQSL